jgi:hypothetical protein
MQTARGVKVEVEAKAALERGAISRQGCLEDGARGIVALHHAGVRVHPVDNVTFAEGDGVALFQAGECERRVADLPDEPVPDIRKRIDPEEFRPAIAEQCDLNREPLHGRPGMPGERKEAGQGLARALHCCRHDGVIEREIIKSAVLGVRRIRVGRRCREAGCARGIEYFRKPFCGFLRCTFRRHGATFPPAPRGRAPVPSWVARDNEKVQAVRQRRFRQ